MEKYLGSIPKNISFESDNFSDLFDKSGRIKKHRNIEKDTLENILKKSRNDLAENEIKETCDFLNKIWTYDPQLRININQILNHGFL